MYTHMDTHMHKYAHSERELPLSCSLSLDQEVSYNKLVAAEILSQTGGR